MISNTKGTWLKNHREQLFVISSFLFISVIIAVLSYSLLKDRNWFPNTDIIQNLFFSDSIRDNNSLAYSLDLNHELSESIFGARGMVINQDKDLVPTSMFGYVIVIGLVKKISNSLVPFINPVFAFISLLYLYALTRVLFKDKRMALMSTLLFGFAGAFLYNSSILYNNIAAVAFFLGGTYYLYKCAQQGGLKYFLLFALFANLAFWMRYPILLLFIPTLIYFLFSQGLKKSILYGMASLPIFAISGAGFMYLNNEVYGSYLGFLKPGFILNDYELYSKPIEKSSFIERIFKFNISKFSLNILKHVSLQIPACRSSLL